MSALPLKFKHQLAAVVTAEQLRERVGERVDVAAYGVFDAAQPPVVKPARHFRDCSSSRHTAAVSLPPATSRSGGINLRTICSGLCGLLVAMILSSFPALNMDRKTLVRLDQPAGVRSNRLCRPRIGDRGELEKPNAVGKFIGQIRRNLHCQARFADPARPGQRDEAMCAQRRFDLGDLGLTPDQASSRRTEVPPTWVEGPQGRKVFG
jgi:hypothetical protein